MTVDIGRFRKKTFTYLHCRAFAVTTKHFVKYCNRRIFDFRMFCLSPKTPTWDLTWLWKRELRYFTTLRDPRGQLSPSTTIIFSGVTAVPGRSLATWRKSLVVGVKCLRTVILVTRGHPIERTHLPHAACALTLTLNLSSDLPNFKQLFDAYSSNFVKIHS